MTTSPRCLRPCCALLLGLLAAPACGGGDAPAAPPEPESASGAPSAGGAPGAGGTPQGGATPAVGGAPGGAGSGGSVTVGGSAGSGTGGTPSAGGSAGLAGAPGAGGEPAPGAGGEPAAGGAGGQASCALRDSGAVAASRDGEIIENLRIVSTSGPAIRVAGHRGITIRNVSIRHAGGPGIEFSDADDLVIEEVAIEHTGAPDSGPNPSTNLNNIEGQRSARVTIDRVRLIRGSSGVYLVGCPDSHLSHLEGYDFRGPFPRGQLVQWNQSNDGVLEDFSVVSPPGSWPEDNINIYASTGALVRRGLVDGNNSPSGVGVIFDDGATGVVEDVDAVRMGNGCFSAYDGGDGSVFRRTRCRENLCTDQGRGLPRSNALMWCGRTGLSSLRIEDSSYHASCNDNLVWPRDSFAVVELTDQDFALRERQSLGFCWE